MDIWLTARHYTTDFPLLSINKEGPKILSLFKILLSNAVLVIHIVN